MRIRYHFKRLMDGIRALSISKELMSHDQWTRQELERFQHQQLLYLVRHAIKYSPFYKELYGNINLDEPFSITQLPVVDKKLMMANFHQFVTDPQLDLADVQSHLSNLSGDEYYLEKYRVLSTSGSSGLSGVFVYNRKEWSTALASLMKAGRYAGVSPRVPHRRKLSIIAANHPRHASTRLSLSSDFGLYIIQRLTAIDPIGNIVEALNSFEPEAVSLYASIGVLLAIEQIEGRLKICPRVVFSNGELCTDDMAQKMEMAWGIKPFSLYAMTEAMGFGTTCSYNKGIHAFEDLAILEVVDQNNSPVPDGTPGHKILITNLYNYTQPLIRYEVSDMLTMSKEACPCKRPFRLISRIDGRNDDILQLEGIRSSSVWVHPILFRSLLGSFQQLKEYQVVYEGGDIHLHLVLRSSEEKDVFARDVVNKLKQKLESLDVKCPSIYIHFAEQLERDPKLMGKMKLIRADKKNKE